MTILVAIIILSVLVLIHEFGHFLTARFFGIGVEEFALGLPFTKPLLSKKLKSGLKISLYPVLFGGFVKLLGEEADIKSKNSFSARPVGQRMGVVVAGVFMNLATAVVLFYVLLGVSNFKMPIPKLSDYRFLSPNFSAVLVSSVIDPSPAAAAKISPGEIILTADGRKFGKLSDFQNYTKMVAKNEGAMRLTLADTFMETTREVTVSPRKSPPEGQGAIGIGIGPVVVLTYQTVVEKISSGLIFSADMLIYNLSVLKSFIVKAFQLGNIEPVRSAVSGPVGIVSIVGDILTLPDKQKILSLINLSGLLSLSLGFMNILPIPAMDGGRLAFLVVEAVTRRKLSPKKENLVNHVGFVLLLALIFLISASDIAKVISSLKK